MDISREELTAIKSQLLELQAQLGIRKSQTDQFLKDMDINDVRVPYVFREWPKAMVLKQDPPRVGQIDHPGFDHCTVADKAEYDEKSAQGWYEIRPSFSPADAAKHAAEAVAQETADLRAENSRLAALLAQSSKGHDGNKSKSERP